MPNWRGLANWLIRSERERIFGVRREKIYVWNKELHEWDEKKQQVWLKDKDGKEIPLIDETKEERKKDDPE